jgi:hypothetical protein
MESRNDSFSFMLSSGAPPHPSAADLAVDPPDREKNLRPLSPLGMIRMENTVSTARFFILRQVLGRKVINKM